MTFLSKLLEPKYRGMLLDITVFVANLLLMRMLSRSTLGVIRGAGGGDFWDELVLVLIAIAMFILPPLGATLKRRSFHARLSASGEERPPKFGCFFNPLFYFCLTVLIYCAIQAAAMQFFYNGDPPGGVFAASLFAGLALMIAHTVLVYRFFSPPTHAPRFAFFATPLAASLGDACIFLNVLLFQLGWNVLTGFAPGRVSGLADLGGRIFLLSFLALLFYFPPRIFYLAEDIGKPRTWITMLLANSPVILRVLIGSSTGQSGW